MSRIHPQNKAACLETICASNYQKLLSLIPNIRNLAQSAVGKASKKPDLQLEVLERSAHTLTVKLSHRFDQLPNDLWVPDVTVRIYLDAELAEVLRDHARSDVSRVYKDPGKISEILNYKWQLNYFLLKWLDHCLSINYQFTDRKVTEVIA
ncbi:MAG: DUF1249 domain-containing protein [Gammaproteobacteria bacterium]|nr:DUF1249 domain-containing protein [Gammaproteobacteria bacterium]